MTRRGRRAGLMAGYAAAVVGAVLAVAAVRSAALPLMLAGMLLIGIGNGGAQLSRYAAADLVDPARRGLALGALVWAGTIGAVVGPNLMTGAGDVAVAVGVPVLGGGLLLAVVTAAAAWGAAGLLPATPPIASPALTLRPAPRLVSLFAPPAVRLAATAMLISQLVMVLVMTATPLHIHLHGHGLDTVGVVLSVHTLGMFALAPLSGKLADHWGSRAVIMAGVATQAIAMLLAATTTAISGPLLPFALFLLGYGWNLSLVGGSRLLTHDVAVSDQTRVQGAVAVEMLIWGTSALATLASGALFALGGFGLLAGAAGALVALPALIVARTSIAPSSTE